MAVTTAHVRAQIPANLLAEARAAHPELAYVSDAQALKFALALAAGKDRKEAREAMRDARLYARYLREASV